MKDLHTVCQSFGKDDTNGVRSLKEKVDLHYNNLI